MSVPARMPSAGANSLVWHAFTFLGPRVAPSWRGMPISRYVELGRYAVHEEASARAGVTVLSCGSHQLSGLITGLEATATRGVRDPASIRLARDPLGFLQLHIGISIDANASDLAEHLRVWCHDRQKIQIGGQSLKSWVANQVGVPDSSIEWEEDVLQIVSLSHQLSADIRRSVDRSNWQSLTRIVYRDPQGQFIRTPSPPRMPVELNRGDHQIAAHGRGVTVLGGQSLNRQYAVQLMAFELLFALSRVRAIRRMVDNSLTNVRQSGQQGFWQQLGVVEELSEKIREGRISLAVEVESFADGLFMPEIVLDDLRHSLRVTLRLDDFIRSTKSMLDSLSQVTETYKNEASVRASARRAAAQKKWTQLASIVTSLVLPATLLLAYFSVSSEVNVPPTKSIFDFSYFWVAWVTTAVLSIAILVFTLLPGKNSHDQQ